MKRAVARFVLELFAEALAEAAAHELMSVAGKAINRRIKASQKQKPTDEDEPETETPKRKAPRRKRGT